MGRSGEIYTKLENKYELPSIDADRVEVSVLPLVEGLFETQTIIEDKYERDPVAEGEVEFAKAALTGLGYNTDTRSLSSLGNGVTISFESTGNRLAAHLLQFGSVNRIQIEGQEIELRPEFCVQYLLHAFLYLAPATSLKLSAYIEKNRQYTGLAPALINYTNMKVDGSLVLDYSKIAKKLAQRYRPNKFTGSTTRANVIRHRRLQFLADLDLHHTVILTNKRSKICIPKALLGN